MNNNYINEIATVQSPDFDSLYHRIERRIAIRKIASRSLIAAVFILAAVVLFPRQSEVTENELLSYSDYQLDFVGYDPLAPLFEESQPSK